MRATDAGAARNSLRRWTCTMLRGLAVQVDAPSRAPSRRRRRSRAAGHGSRPRCARGSAPAGPRTRRSPRRRAGAAGTSRGPRRSRRCVRGRPCPAAVRRKKRPSSRLCSSVHFLAEMEHRVHRLDLLHEPVDEFLRAADGQCRNVVYRFVRIQLGALAARVLERVDDVALDAEQAELEDLEQAGGPGADDRRRRFRSGWRSGRLRDWNRARRNLRKGRAILTEADRAAARLRTAAKAGLRYCCIRHVPIARTRPIPILDAHQGWLVPSAGMLALHVERRKTDDFAADPVRRRPRPPLRPLGPPLHVVSDGRAVHRPVRHPGVSRRRAREQPGPDPAASCRCTSTSRSARARASTAAAPRSSRATTRRPRRTSTACTARSRCRASSTTATASSSSCTSAAARRRS